MNRILAVPSLILAVAFNAIQSVNAETVVVRDRKGKIIERRYTTGGKAVVRDAKEKKIRVEIVRGKKKEIRDANGRLIGVETIQ